MWVKVCNFHTKIIIYISGLKMINGLLQVIHVSLLPPMNIKEGGEYKGIHTLYCIIRPPEQSAGGGGHT